MLGACAAIAALSAVGLPSDRFSFEGFLPSKSSQRLVQLEKLKDETQTLIFMKHLTVFWTASGIWQRYLDQSVRSVLHGKLPKLLKPSKNDPR